MWSFEVLSLFHLRRVSTLTEARRWIEPVPGLPLAAIGSLPVILFSGIYLAMKMSAFGLAWPTVVVGSLLLIAAHSVHWPTHAGGSPSLRRCQGNRF